MSGRLKITIAGESKTRAQWAKTLGVTRGAIHFREQKYGESPQEAVWHFYYGYDDASLRRLRARLAEADKAMSVLCDAKFVRSLEKVLDAIKKLKEVKR